MLEALFLELVKEFVHHAAFEGGNELGHELRNCPRVVRGEAEWEELTHTQQTMFFGGDRDAYENIRQKLKSGRGTTGSSAKCRDQNPPRVHRGDGGRFFDYGKF